MNNWVCYREIKEHGYLGDEIKLAHKKPKVGGGAPKRKRLGDSSQTNGKLC